MATVDKKTADDIIAGKYEEDDCQKIVEYDNAWGGVSYGCMFAGDDLNNYRETQFVRNPRLYWERKQ